MNLKYIREQKGISQRELAKRAQMSFRTLQHYEQGTREIDSANLDTILNICVALDCRITDILTRADVIEKFNKVMKGGA